MIRVLIVDDEQTARERLRHLLGLIPGVEVAGEAADGELAIARIAELRPDLVLMDIQMPGCSGLEVAASLPSPRPKIVFCTAFDQYAVDAFELHAVDYLLKPVNRIRLAHAIERVRGSGAAEASNGIDRALEAVAATNLRLLARVGDRYRVIPLADAAYFSSGDRLTQPAHPRARIRGGSHPQRTGRASRPGLLFSCLARRHRQPERRDRGSAAHRRRRRRGAGWGARLEVSRRRLKDLLRALGGVPGIPDGHLSLRSAFTTFCNLSSVSFVPLTAVPARNPKPPVLPSNQKERDTP